MTDVSCVCLEVDDGRPSLRKPPVRDRLLLDGHSRLALVSPKQEGLELLAIWRLKSEVLVVFELELGRGRDFGEGAFRVGGGVDG